MRFSTVTLASACLALSACMTTTEATRQSTSDAPELTFMTQQELLETIPGSTLFGISDDGNETEWVQTYSAGGKSGSIAGMWDGEPYDATWSVDGNKWCEKWETGSHCLFMVREASNRLQAYKSAAEPFRNPISIR